MIELLLLGAAVGTGLAAAKVSVGHRAESRHARAGRFTREFKRITPPEGAVCLQCGKALTSETTKVIFFPRKDSAPEFVCDATKCLLTHYQGAAMPRTQAILPLG